MRYVAIEIEGALGRRETIEARRRQASQQQIAVGAVAPDVAVEFVPAVEGSESGGPVARAGSCTRRCVR